MKSKKFKTSSFFNLFFNLCKRGVKETDGFVLIVAMGIFALLIIYGLMMQSTTIATYQNIKNWNNYYAAQRTADSVAEYMQYKLNILLDDYAGYNSGKVECVFENGNLNRISTVDPNNECSAFLPTAIDKEYVKITWEIKGRAEAGEGIKTNQCGTGSYYISGANCFVVPFPGTGDAGNMCKMYKPVFYGQAGNSTVETWLTGGQDNLDQLNYSCNWGKLQFGSSYTDRVAIPLYYSTDAGPVNPFNGAGSSVFMLRMRTPCLPCVYEGDASLGINRLCTRSQNPTICGDGDRYELDDGGSFVDPKNDIVAQWQISGTCGGEECGLMPDLDDPYSPISEYNINNQLGWGYRSIDNSRTMSIRTDLHLNNEPEEIYETLDILEKPILTLSLSSALISREDRNIPYLEYQIISEKIIGNPKTKMEVTVNVNGNGSKKTLYKEVQKGLIDFAVQTN